MKVSNYHLSCNYANLGQFYRDRKKFFSTTHIGYFCALRLCFCYYGFDFLSRLLLETKESSIKLHGNRKGSYHIGCEFPVCPQSKHGLSKNTLIFPTFTVAQNLHLLSFCNSFQVCSSFQVGLQRFSKKCPTLIICALTVPVPLQVFSRALAQEPFLFLRVNRAQLGGHCFTPVYNQ